MGIKPVIVAVDFDGTIVKHEYPEIGAPVPGALEFLRELQADGVRTQWGSLHG